MDREEECVCCHEIEQVANKNQEVIEYTKPTLPYDCITDNPGWILSSSTEAQHNEGPEHKISRHCAYRQLVRWCWGVVGKEIRDVSDLFDFMTTDAFLFPIDEHENTISQYKL